MGEIVNCENCGEPFNRRVSFYSFCSKNPECLRLRDSQRAKLPKRKEARKKYAEKHKEEIKEWKREWHQKKRKTGEYQEYRDKNRSRINENKRREYYRNKESYQKRNKQWREKNKEKISEQKKEYYHQNKDAVREYLKNNREKIKKRKMEWRLNNPEKVKQHKEKSLKKPENREKARKRARCYYKENKPKYFANAAARRSEYKKDMELLTQEEKNKVYEIYELSQELSLAAKSSGSNEIFHVDHIKPLSKGGKHHPDNLQILLASENRSKSDKLL